MKKLLSIALIAISVSLSAQSTYKWPTAAASNITIGAGATNNLTLVNNMSYVSSITTLTANTTVSVTASSSLKAGSVFILTVKTTSLQTVTFSGAIAAPTFTGVAGKTFSQGYIYNGTKYYPLGTVVQVD